jgi:hypothetical protein
MKATAFTLVLTGLLLAYSCKKEKEENGIVLHPYHTKFRIDSIAIENIKPSSWTGENPDIYFKIQKWGKTYYESDTFMDRKNLYLKVDVLLDSGFNSISFYDYTNGVLNHHHQTFPIDVVEPHLPHQMISQESNAGQITKCEAWGEWIE